MPRENKRNYYRIMHVQADAPVEIIRSSYQTLMQRLKMHPDLGGDHWNAALINEAYAILSDPVKRDEYDRQLADANPETVAPTPANESRHAASAENPASSVAANRCPFCQASHRYASEIDANADCSTCGGPLCRAEPPDHEASWMRAVDRFPKNQSVAFYTGWPQSNGYYGQILDISITGMQFATNEPVTRHQFIKIHCATCSTIARVAYCRRAPDDQEFTWRVGVEFFTLRFERSRGAFVSDHA